MRKQFVSTISDLMEKDDRLALFLGDIGVFGFKEVLNKFSNRAFNIGILEQSTVSLAAGFSHSGFLPVVHTIAPFIIERALEQIKIDFAFQRLPGNFVSVGASYDYSALGSTHHCPADIGILKLIPGMEIVIPGNSSEFDKLFKQSYYNDNPTYFRLSEKENSYKTEINFGEATVIRKGIEATVIVVGNLLDTVVESCLDMDVNIIYLTSLFPLDYKIFDELDKTGKFLIVEPFYGGVILNELHKIISNRGLIIENISVPLDFLSKYGKASEHDLALGFDSRSIREKLVNLINL